MAVIDQPGVYDISADAYHADPVKGGSLSASGSRKLLPPYSPAQYRYELTKPPKSTDDQILGSAVHKLVLGAGNDVVQVEADSWRTKDAKEQKAKALAEGKYPLLPDDYATAQDMAAAVRRHKLAAALLRDDRGKPERTLVWRDAETGIWCRAMVDWLRPRPIVDLKTCVSAHPDKFERAVYEYGYHLQAAHYLDGIGSLGLADKPAMAFVLVEKAPPHLVNVVQLNQIALDAGAFYIRQARLIYAECKAADAWPGYGEDIQLVELPAYAQNRYFQESGK